MAKPASDPKIYGRWLVPVRSRTGWPPASRAGAARGSTAIASAPSSRRRCRARSPDGTLRAPQLARQVVGRGLGRACPTRDELNQHRPRPARGAPRKPSTSRPGCAAWSERLFKTSSPTRSSTRPRPPSRPPRHPRPSTSGSPTRTNRRSRGGRPASSTRAGAPCSKARTWPTFPQATSCAARRSSSPTDDLEGRSGSGGAAEWLDAPGRRRLSGPLGSWCRRSNRRVRILLGNQPHLLPYSSFH